MSTTLTPMDKLMRGIKPETAEDAGLLVVKRYWIANAIELGDPAQQKKFDRMFRISSRNDMGEVHYSKRITRRR